MPYPEAKAELLKLTGVGPKVADCILLMSLDQPSSVPVDTHMFQIAAQNYLPHLKKYKTVTDKAGFFFLFFWKRQKKNAR